MRDLVELQVHLTIGAGKVGLVGDDANGAGLARRAVKRALRPGERLDPGNIENMDVERAGDGRDRLFVQVGPDAGQRRGVVGVFAAGDAAEIDIVRPRAVSAAAAAVSLIVFTTLVVSPSSSRTSTAIMP